MARYGRKRLGLITPSGNTTMEDDFARWMPDSVSLHVARVAGDLTRCTFRPIVGGTVESAGVPDGYPGRTGRRIRDRSLPSWKRRHRNSSKKGTMTGYEVLLTSSLSRWPLFTR